MIGLMGDSDRNAEQIGQVPFERGDVRVRGRSRRAVPALGRAGMGVARSAHQGLDLADRQPLGDDGAGQGLCIGIADQRTRMTHPDLAGGNEIAD